MQEGKNKKEVTMLVSSYFDLEKNVNFNVFQKIFARLKPSSISKCCFEEYFNDDLFQAKVIRILDSYLNERQKGNIKI
jgi:hypothetical protein